MTQLTTVDVPVSAPRGANRDDVRPFKAHVSDSDVADLRRRLAATRWPNKETVADASQGVPLTTMQKLARYWASDTRHVNGMHRKGGNRGTGGSNNFLLSIRPFRFFSSFSAYLLVAPRRALRG